MLTKERAEKLSAYLTEDMQRTDRLLDMEPADALVVINGDGHDFTLEELNEYCAVFNHEYAKAANQGELSEEDLADVAGGVDPFTMLAIGVAVGFAAIAVFGYKQTKKSKFKW